MTKTDLKAFDAFFKEETEAKFDVRLVDKKLDHGSMTRQERDSYLKSLPEEKDFDFTSAEALDAEEATALTEA